MKVNLLTRYDISNINEAGEFIYYPIILSAEFTTLGRFNIVVLSPDGLGVAFYTGWAKPGKFKRTWTLPIQQKMGAWDIVVVFTPKEGGIDHTSLNATLTEKTVNYSSIDPANLGGKSSAEEKIPFKLTFPNKDVTLPYPYLWISGEAGSEIEIKVEENSYITTPDQNNLFLLPIKVDFGAYSLLTLTGGRGTPGFESTYSIFSIKGTIESVLPELLRCTISKSIQIMKLEDEIENSIIVTQPYYCWELPVNNLCSTKKFQLIRGWAEQGCEIIVDGKVIPVNSSKDDNGNDDSSRKKIGFFEYLHPIRIGINELEIKVTNKEGVVARENRFIECTHGKISLGLLDPVNSSKDQLKTSKDNIIIRGQVSAGTKLNVNEKPIDITKDGYFELKVNLNTGLNNVQINGTKEKNEEDNNENFYSIIRNGETNLDEIKYLSMSQVQFLNDNDLATISDFFSFNITEDLDKPLLEELYQLQKYLGFLLLGKDSLALFTEFEAYLISQLSDLKSIEELISIDPEDLVNELNTIMRDIFTNEELRDFTIGDANRWQRTLDDFLLEYQEDYIV